jgi:hypothetical protein
LDPVEIPDLKPAAGELGVPLQAVQDVLDRYHGVSVVRVPVEAPAGHLRAIIAGPGRYRPVPIRPDDSARQVAPFLQAVP